MRIAVDIDLCQGHGVCESEAPEVFEVGRDRKVHVSADALTLLDDERRAQVELAVRYCPTHAISVVDQD
jgi:ferredoxin